MFLLKRWAAATLYWVIILVTNLLEKTISENADNITVFILLGLWAYDAIWLRVNDPSSARHPPSEKLELLFSNISTHFKNIDDEVESSDHGASAPNNQAVKKISDSNEAANEKSSNGELAGTNVLACGFYIEIPCLPLENLEEAKVLASEIKDFNLSIQETHICINQEGEEVSILLGTNTLSIDDSDSLIRLRDLALREELPVVLYARTAPSYRKGFWPDDDDDWIEQTRNLNFWTEHLHAVVSLSGGATQSLASSSSDNTVAPARSLEEVINEIQEQYEDAFVELESPWRENILPNYCEDAPKVSFGIGLFAESNSEFGISIHMYLENWDTGDPVAFDDAVGDKEGLMDDLMDVAFTDIAALANRGNGSSSSKFPHDIIGTLNGAESPYEFWGYKIYWNDEHINP